MFAQISAFIFGVLLGAGVGYVIWFVIPKNRKM
jgi:hypothetical protein